MLVLFCELVEAGMAEEIQASAWKPHSSAVGHPAVSILGGTSLIMVFFLFILSSGLLCRQLIN